MTAPISLVMMGGAGESGKSALATKIEEQKGVVALRVSDYLREPLGVDTNIKLGAEAGNVDWKSKAELRAVEALCMDVQAKRSSGHKCVVINSHFATYSPGGFMIGLDPPSLEKICKACGLYEENQRYGEAKTVGHAKAAVVLVDIGISDVLKRREAVWKEKPAFSMGFGLMQDLELNRLYSIQYYQALGMVLGPQRVFYQRLVLDWRDMDPGKDLVNTAEFWRLSQELLKFLNDSGII